MKYKCDACNGTGDLNGLTCSKCDSKGYLVVELGTKRLLNNNAFEDNGTGVIDIVDKHFNAMYKELGELDSNINKRDIFYIVMSCANNAHLDDLLGL